ncbi:hypothetical protein F0562_030888 [Nyssa sinensis]|uniref:Uncharacterized protein n=1 Tax=Nyssa sinensis TaxID=561372 RepID=A0A5J5AXS6_9ASTE|nr:hypothetical protein F0562_030888 [Nyssa sinensis]
MVLRHLDTWRRLENAGDTEGCKRCNCSSLLETEAELEEEETETCEKSAVDKSLQKTVIHNDSEQNPDSALPATPLRGGIRWKKEHPHFTYLLSPLLPNGYGKSANY